MRSAAGNCVIGVSDVLPPVDALFHLDGEKFEFTCLSLDGVSGKSGSGVLLLWNCREPPVELWRWYVLFVCGGEKG